MILSYTRGKNPLLQHAIDLPFLDKTIEFTPGINIVVGENGTGKSTLINAIRRLMLCDFLGYQYIEGPGDISSMYDDDEWDKQKRIFSDSIEHDGAPIISIDVTEIEEPPSGRHCGRMLTKHIFNLSHSSGERQYNNMQEIMDFELKPFKEIVEKFRVRANDLYRERADLHFEFWKEGLVKVKKKKICLTADESVSHMSLWNKIIFFESLVDSPYQIILITHDILPIMMNLDANYIETEPGYLNKVKKKIKQSTKRFVNNN